MPTVNLPAIDTLTEDAKRELLGALLLDLATPDANLLPVEAGGRRFYVYTPPSDARAAAQRLLDACPPECLEELRRRASDPPDKFMSLEDVMKIADQAEGRSSGG